jgi:RsiW-degrading membrane proteinase PrsW (M82 family)
VLDYYSALASTEDTSDLGRYALGLIADLNQADVQALGYYAAVGNRDLKYLNFSLGQLYRQRGEPERAEQYLQREIALNGNMDEAVPELTNLYLEQEEISNAQALAEDEWLRSYIDAGILRKLAFHSRNWGAYLQATFISPYQVVNPLGAGTALIIGLTWLLYFVRLSAFNRTPFRLYLAALCLGAAFANASLMLSDFFAEFFSIYLADERLRLLAMSVVNIGLVEEIAKFLPVLIVIRLARRLDEPFELLAYGCLSALGFATLENVFYISKSGLNIALGRFLISSVFHIAMTTIVCYIWAGARSFRPGGQLKAVLLGLALAATLHGLFDYFMMGALGDLLAASYAIAFLMAREMQRMLCNALNQSSACALSPAASLRMNNFGLFLSASLAILLIVYLSYHAGLSTYIANRQAPLVGLANLPGFIVVFGSLGRLTLTPGKMIPLNNFGFHRPLKRWIAKARFEPV